MAKRGKIVPGKIQKDSKDIPPAGTKRIPKPPKQPKPSTDK